MGSAYCPNALHGIADGSVRKTGKSISDNELFPRGSETTSGFPRGDKDKRRNLKNAPQEAAFPSLWGTFVLVGDDAPVSFHSDKWLIALLTIGMAGLIVYFFFLKRRI